MVHDLSGRLREIEAMAKRIDKIGEAEQAFSELIDQTDPATLDRARGDLTRTIKAVFLPRRAEALLLQLDEVASDDIEEELAPLPPGEMAQFERELVSELRELSAHHIFQWSTFYFDVVKRFTEKGIELNTRSSSLADICGALNRAFDAHAHEIFLKGYRHEVSI